MAGLFLPIFPFADNIGQKIWITILFVGGLRLDVPVWHAARMALLGGPQSAFTAFPTASKVATIHATGPLRLVRT